MTEKWYERAKRRMKALKVSQDDLKTPLGVKTRGAVSHYLTGRNDPSPDQLLVMARALKTTVSGLLGEEPMHQVVERSDAHMAIEMAVVLRGLPDSARRRIAAQIQRELESAQAGA